MRYTEVMENMFDSWVVRLISVVLVMLIVGFGWFKIGFARLKKKGLEEAQARSKAEMQAKKSSVIAAFLYMVAMVSIAGLFM